VLHALNSPPDPLLITSEREDNLPGALIIAQSSGEGKVLGLLHFSQQRNYSLCVEAIP